MISVDDALARVINEVEPLPSELVPLAAADGRVLAEPIISTLMLPPFANSAMDGYAFRASHVAQASPEQPIFLMLVESISAGMVGKHTVGPGQAARIMTGAPIPSGADAVIKYEDTTNPTPDTVAITQPVTLGNCIRLPGEDVQIGAQVVPAPAILTPPTLGLCAALG
ncbi:MAG: molybdopterin molybdenumtransferase MoeA, partial [Ktedonobacterales bacterium]|nr:molybdopterin molybdenumtransferase MoeA [Ktedonobacterales bacterium]